jgi:drug/metabolite transporter (DMT)-like permease
LCDCHSTALLSAETHSTAIYTAVAPIIAAGDDALEKNQIHHRFSSRSPHRLWHWQDPWRIFSAMAPVTLALTGTTATVLIVTYISTSSLLTLITKLADITTSLGIDGTVHKFNHPLMQTWFMFVGEAVCLIAYWMCFHKSASTDNAKSDPEVASQVASATEPKTVSIFAELVPNADSVLDTAASLQEHTYPVWIFAPPALLDMLATVLLRFGLEFTYTSTFQMLRGSVIFFTAMLSLLWFGRRLAGYQWTGLGTLIVGLVLVGVSSVISGVNQVQAPNPVLGNVLLASAQAIVALHLVAQEYFLNKYRVPPMLFVGCEGHVGSNFHHGAPRWRLLDPRLVDRRPP